MDRFKRSAIVLSLIETLEARESFCGETHIQKAVYFLQELVSVDTGFEFILYKHGPFSFDLSDELRAMRANKFLSLVPTPPYGACLKQEDMGNNLRNDYSEFLSNFNRQIEFVAEKIGNKRVDYLEKLSTALYVTKEKQDDNVESRAIYMHNLKPHITFSVVREFLKLVDDLLKVSNSI